MRLGLVAVVMVFAACGPMPEENAAAATTPVRIARLSLDQRQGVRASTSTVPLELRLQVWADGTAAGDFTYRGLPDPFAEVGSVTAGAKQWRLVAGYRDESGQHSLEREVQLISPTSLESLVLCFYDAEGQPPEGAVVLITEPVVRAAPPAGDALPGLLQEIGFDVPHTDYDWTEGPYHAELHDRVHWDAKDWAEARSTGQLEPGLYHLELQTPRSTLLAPGVVQVDRYVSLDDFAIEK